MMQDASLSKQRLALRLEQIEKKANYTAQKMGKKARTIKILF